MKETSSGAKIKQNASLFGPCLPKAFNSLSTKIDNKHSFHFHIFCRVLQEILKPTLNYAGIH